MGLVILGTFALSASGCALGDHHKAATYQACLSTSQCDINNDCMATRYGGLCTQSCDTESDCPDDGACLSPNAQNDAGSDARLCFARCSTDLDCDFGFACTTIDAANPSFGSICR